MPEKTKSPSLAMRRGGVIVNYLTLVVFLILFFVVRNTGWDWKLVAGAVVSLIIFVWTFIVIHPKTGLWKLVHMRFDKLDEREALVNYEALRLSYGIFAVICLLIIFINSAVERGNIHVLIAASLLYIAHTLPSSIIAWKEKEV